MDLEGHPVGAWGSEEVIDMFLRCSPDLRDAPEGKDGVRDFLKPHLVAKAEVLTGRHLLEMYQRMCEGGQEQLRERVLQEMNELLGERGATEFSRLLCYSANATRNAATLIQTIFHKLILMGSDIKMDRLKKKLFEVISEEWHNTAFDSFFPKECRWLIKSGDIVIRDLKGLKVPFGSYCSPAGWLRLALHRQVPAEDIATWHKAYHGTAGRNLESIIANSLVPPRMVGGEIQHRHGTAGAGGVPTIYCSPSLEYAAHWLYTDEDARIGQPGAHMRQEHCGALDFTTLSSCIQEAGGAWSQFVFELRVNPESYRVQGNTLHHKLWPHRDLLYDPDCSSHNLEWLVTDPRNVVCTGVMVRALPASPKEYNERRIEFMKNLVGWSETEKKPTRPRTDGGVPEGKAGRWEWNGNPATGSTLTTDPGAKWQQYDKETSKLIEAAYKEYRRTCFIGRPGGAEGPAYAIDFGKLCGLSKGDPMQVRADGDMENGWRRRAVRRVPL